MKIMFVQKLIDKLRGKKKVSFLSKYKYIHLMFNDKFNKPFVDFLNRNFNPEEHVVLCKRWFKEHPFPEGKNVVEIANLLQLEVHKGQKLICHSLFDEELVRWLYSHKSVLKKQAYWVIWGGDLYEAPRDEVNDYVRKNFKGLISAIEGDEKVAAKKYSSNAKLLTAPYICPIDKMLIETTLNNYTPKKNSSVYIQINNSADSSTLGMLDVLSKYHDENIKITTILSYGNLDVKNEIIEKGKNIFGDKFEYIENFMAPEAYIRHMMDVDILVMCQNRQQGVGNIILATSLGKKVFVKSEITTFRYLSSRGIKLFNTEDISNMKWQMFAGYPEKDKSSSIKNSLLLLDWDYLKCLWKDVLGE